MKRFGALFLLAVSSTARPANGPFAIQQAHRDSGGMTFRAANGTIRIEFCGLSAVHVVVSRTADLPTAKVPIVTRPCRAEAVRIQDGKDEIRLSTPVLTVAVNRATGAIRFVSEDGRTVLAEPAQGGKSFDVPSLAEAKQWQVQQSFQSPSDEALYGLGQHQEGILNLHGVPIRLHQANTNISIPFLLSSRGYGLLWNNPSLTDFNPADEPVAVDATTGNGKFKTGGKGRYGFLLTSDNRKQLALEVDGHPVIDLHNMWMPTSASGVMDLEGDREYEVSAQGGPGGVQLAARAPQATTTFRSEIGPAIDYYFFYGPELNQVISDYRRLTGEAPLFPKWAYGFWQCRERYHSQQEILETADEFRKRKLPVDALVQDWQYWGKYGWNAMKFDEDHYPRPKALLDQLHSNDLHLMVSVWSRFGEETDVYKRMSARSFLLSGTPWTDFFNPDAQKAFWAELNNEIFKDGMDAWWMDASEPEFDVLKGETTFLGSGESVRNAYPLYVTKAIYEGQRSTTDRKRVVILTRSAFAGQQRNAAASWSGDITGDWTTLRRQVAAGLSFSMSGLPYWTTDIGGFFRPPDQYTNGSYQELLIRWFEYGSFCPIFRVHGYQSNAEPWNYGPDVENVLAQFDDLRYRLLPYIYSAAWGVTNRGETLMRALPLEFSSDPVVREISDQFLFGHALMINPVLEAGATKRLVYLPAGSDWIDFWTGKRIPGGQSISADAPIDKLPMYAKAGSIIPFGPRIQSASAKSDPVEFRVYPGADGDFTLYEDEGDSYDYEHGAHSVIPIHWSNTAETITVGDRTGTFPGVLQRRTFRIVIVKEGHGTGREWATEPDALIQYQGKAISMDIRTGIADRAR